MKAAEERVAEDSQGQRVRLQRGLTLVELMVALAVGLLIVAALSFVFVSSSAARQEVERSADVIENGRYGVDVLAREISQAGFYASLITPTGTVNSLCPAGIPSAVVTSWTGSMAIAVQGLNNTQADPACLTRKAGTDAILVQRASTCAIGEAGCDAEDANHAYLQVSQCGTEYSVSPSVLGIGGGAVFTLRTKACDPAIFAEKRRLLRRIYYVSANDVLSSVDLSLSGAGTPVALVENIEQLQFEYGIDSNDDGNVDSFSSTPADWSKVIGVRAWVLARSATPSKNSAAAVTYTMGDTTLAIPAAASNLKRRVYSSYFPLNTPKLRNEK